MVSSARKYPQEFVPLLVRRIVRVRRQLKDKSITHFKPKTQLSEDKTQKWLPYFGNMEWSVAVLSCAYLSGLGTKEGRGARVLKPRKHSAAPAIRQTRRRLVLAGLV